MNNSKTAYAVEDWVGGSLFEEGGPEGVFDLQGTQTPQPPGEGLLEH